MDHISTAAQSQDPVQVQSKIALTGWAVCVLELSKISDYRQKGQIISKPFFLKSRDIFKWMLEV